MRIVGGNLRGRKIFQPKDKKTRPLRDLVKESVFNLLEHSSKFNCRIENSEILDLFSGVGSSAVYKSTASCFVSSVQVDILLLLFL